MKEISDQRKAECPSCHKSLFKIPGAKTKCPHCGVAMFVRTRPQDRVRMVVTKADADEIDKDWAVCGGITHSFIPDQIELEKEKKILRNKFAGKEPSNADVIWAILNKRIIEEASSGNYGLYRNGLFDMAEIARGEFRLKQALQFYFEVCYFDLNGSNNAHPPFDPTRSALAPMVIYDIQKIINRLDIYKNEIRTIFIEHNLKMYGSWKLPLSPDQCWSELEKEIYK